MKHRIAVGVVAVLVLSGCYGSKKVTTVAGHETVEPVVSGSFEVPPRDFKPFKVVVASGATNPRLEGRFSASGANNDIEVFLLEESQYLNWQNRHTFNATYVSGRVTADKIRMALPPEPATYFVVFSNRFSWISKKAVVADMSLRCEYAKKGY